MGLRIIILKFIKFLGNKIKFFLHCFQLVLLLLQGVVLAIKLQVKVLRLHVHYFLILL